MWRHRKILYGLVNVGFIVLLGTMAAGDSGDQMRFLYLAMLFPLCSAPILFEKPLNGPYALLAMFLAIYFVFYGVGDLSAAWTGRFPKADPSALSEAELVILVGGVLLVLAYRAGITLVSRANSATAPKDWSPGMVVIAGLVLWAAGTYGSWIWNVDLVTDTSNATMRKALGSISGARTTLLMLAQMAKPLGILIIAYAQTVYRRPWMLPILLAVVAVQFVYGFVVDIKGEAMVGGILVILTKTLVSGKLPKMWLAGAALFVVFGFPILQAHRNAAGARSLNHAETAQNLVKAVTNAIDSKDKVNEGRRRAQTFFERASLKTSVELIVTRTGNRVEFQDGATLTPIVATFVPRIIWPTKPSIPVGQVMNREFHVSQVADTYISPSHLGELYWNFGWPGVIGGMILIGLILGYVGGRCDLSSGTSITRLLIAVITIRQMMMGFEGTIAVAYVVWLRSIAAVWLLHLVLARAKRGIDRTATLQQEIPGSSYHRALQA